MELRHQDLTEKIIKSFYTVYNDLGYGFSEKVYENAMIVELQLMGLTAVQQQRMEVFYRGNNIGLYFADIVVNDAVIIELKSCEKIADVHEAQLLNYLKASEMQVGLVMNFGPSATFRRKIFTNDRKPYMHLRNPDSQNR